MAEMVGASFTGLTVKAKILDAVENPSVTAKVRLVEPDSLAAGVKLATQLAGVPAKAMLFAATSKLLLEVAATLEQRMVSSVSPKEKVTVLSVSSFVD